MAREREGEREKNSPLFEILSFPLNGVVSCVSISVMLFRICGMLREVLPVIL